MEAYYYAGGNRVDLHADKEHVAVDSAAVPADLLRRLTSGQEDLSELPGNVFIARRSSIPEVDIRSLQLAGALRPVFLRDKAMMVPMPEVRVEVDDATQRKSVESFLSTMDHGMVVAEKSAFQFVLKPASGSSVDALKIANQIYEDAHPAASSVRFVQVVKRRDTTKR